MIDIVEGRPDGTVELTASGAVTGKDYEDVLIPAIESALEQHDRIRLLCHLGPEFESFGIDAAWDDAKLGLRHWTSFERMAIVTDAGWIRGAVRAMGFALPCPVRHFANAELDDARRWLQESLGVIHLDFDPAHSLVTARLIGSLEPRAYRGKAEDIDRFVAEHTPFRLLLDLREFEGWEAIHALGDHLNLIRGHRHQVTRVAICGDRGWQKMAARILPRVAGAEGRYFETDALAEAREWAIG